ncbi:uncharacterized protein LOC130506343 isoform X2 [Raphanus sativus]|uniref:Uncharacterized protein LOC130506343 isoform X2 n=1 Tax=Raphanus sativus TaxID=3726 RepID=A0A9W3D0K0_RAPSA|nr:uncharacterized protein LOC130506343 isoform X2 [Raphanus sativus]
MGKGKKKKGVSLEPKVPTKPANWKKLPKQCLKTLADVGLCEIKDWALKIIMDDWLCREAKSTDRTGPFHISCYVPTVAFLCWIVSDPVFTELLKGTNWKDVLGYIRDQFYHVICWAYASSDLVSAVRVIRKWEDRYIPLSPWYLSSTVAPEKLGTCKSANPGHRCYESTMARALAHIAKEGIPDECPEDCIFNCCESPPTSAKKTYIKHFLTFKTLEKALAHLHIQPIGASLVVFSDLAKPTEDIYYGPLSKKSVFVGYHGVDIVAIEIFRGELVALCKMSNGTEVANQGYVRVSLRVMYMPIFCDIADAVHPTLKPQHLLSNFCCPYMDEAPRENLKRKLKQDHDSETTKKPRHADEPSSSKTPSDLILDDNENKGQHRQETPKVLDRKAQRRLLEKERKAEEKLLKKQRKQERKAEDKLLANERKAKELPKKEKSSG